MSRFNWQLIDTRLIAVAISLFISLLIFLVERAPNDDAYAYIRTAEIALADGVGAAVQHYAWASYSLLIALVSQLGFDLITAAYLINSFFFAVLVYAFLSIVKLIDDSRLVGILAALSILLYPQLNEFRFDIIRDIGYWALSLLALWQFLLFYNYYKYSNLIVFGLTLLLAASFRPEAIIYLIVTPFVLLLDYSLGADKRRAYFARAMGLAVGIIVFAVIVLAIIGISIPALLRDFLSVYEPFINSTFNPNEADSSALSSAIFGEYASSYSGPYVSLFLFTGLLAILVVKLFSGIGGPFFWLLVYGGYKRMLKVKRNLYLPILFFLITNVVIVFTFILITRYVSSRYAMLFCLMLVLLVPLVIANIIKELEKSSLKNTGMRVVILFFGYCAFDSFISFGQSKAFIFDSVDWITAEATSSAGLLTNNHAVAYYSGKVEDYDQVFRLITEAEIRNSRQDDLIAIEMHYEMSELVESTAVKPLLELQAAFPSLSDQQLAIYKRVSP
ncbi:MAG: hypothetical protein OXU66_07040 [Gammaproteobacteria bacterium]|nr:hypothetical protein [Gammaproteobacteria bacterium]